MSEGKFSKPWQVTDKIIEWFILQFISYILWMTQTQEKITCRVLKLAVVPGWHTFPIYGGMKSIFSKKFSYMVNHIEIG